MNQLRLVFITRRFWPLVGSAEKGMANLACGISRLGHKPAVLTARWETRWPRQFSYRGVPVTRLDQRKRRGWGTIRYMRQLARWLRRHSGEMDAVVVSMLGHDAYAALGALGGTSIPVLLRVERSGQKGDCQWHRNTPLGARIRSRCRQADGIVAVTAAIQDELINAGYPSERIHVVPGGVEIPRPWSPGGQRSARATLAETHPVFSIPAAAPLVVCDSPLEETEGVFELVDAWRLITKRWPSARIWLLGDGAECQKLWERIKRFELESNVILPGSFDETDNVLRAAHLFVRPSHDGSPSFSMFEAMAIGIPIVASNIPGHRQFLTQDETGMLVPPRRSQELAAAMAQLLENRQSAAGMGAAARAKAENELSLAVASERYAEIIAEAIARRAHGA